MKIILHLACLLVLFCAALSAQDTSRAVTAEVKLVPAGHHAAPKDMTGSVVWLVSLDHPFTPATADDKHFRMAQKDKRFVPSLLVLPVGSVVDFPNLDPWFHNVFSLYQGKRFDLGLYQAGAQKSVRFDKPGVSYLFCNIHPEMSAAIVAVDTRWYGVSDARGHVVISGVPEGRYELHAWHADATPEALKAAERPVEIGDNRALPTITLAVQPASSTHKNKYGKDYDPDALKPDY
jgi:plastocyanin